MDILALLAIAEAILRVWLPAFQASIPNQLAGIILTCILFEFIVLLFANVFFHIWPWDVNR